MSRSTIKSSPPGGFQHENRTSDPVQDQRNDPSKKIPGVPPGSAAGWQSAAGTAERPAVPA
ncbi:hypothetical protein D3C73_1619010 [compost metagenome]